MVPPHRSRLAATRSVFVFCMMLLMAQGLRACTAFCLKQDGSLLLAKNTDIFDALRDGFLIVNKRGIPKQGITIDPADTPARWVSRYGSVTFNILGRELPDGGMNEAGLVLEGLGLTESRYPERDSRRVLVAWLQYQLDNCATIEQVVESDRTIRIMAGLPVQFHALGCDRLGNTATFEFLDGKLVCHRGDSLPVPVLANDTYDKSLAHLKGHTEFGGSSRIPYGSWVSLDRFVCVADRLRMYRSDVGSGVDWAFDTLAAVRVGEHTRRMAVYDPQKLELHYRTLRYPRTKTIRLSDCDFDPRTPVQTIIVNTAHEGLLNPYLHHYEADLNRWLIYYSFRHITGGNLIPDDAVEMLAEHGDAPGVYYLRDWEVAGPYAQEGKKCTELLELPLGPEKPGADVKWQSISGKQLGSHPAYLDLGERFKVGQAVSYLRTQDEFDEEMCACLEVWSDDGVKVWLNGNLVHVKNVTRGIASQPDIAEVVFKKGTNDLMLKVAQNDGPWGAIVRVRPVSRAEPTPRP